MPPRSSRQPTYVSARQLVVNLTFFLLGCGCCTTLLLHTHQQNIDYEVPNIPMLANNKLQTIDNYASPSSKGKISAPDSLSSSTTPSILDGVRILVAIAAYDFSQIPHLEDVLDTYRDLCYAGAYVDVVVHTTVPYPVALIDLLNSRVQCTNPSPRAGFSVTLILKTPAVKLFLVDFHRTLFYDKLEEYDLFIYTEDDIRVTPTTVASYLYETRRVQELVGGESEASNFNVGIVRYELNFPPDVIIDDKTRHATQNTTRVYWEHTNKPIFPKAFDKVPHPKLSSKYVNMINHHQGMYLATRGLLKAWRDRPKCQFDNVRLRPGTQHQPSEGTQRVWMSSHMLYGKRHCGVQQVIPVDNFGQFNVLHLPNKNYRRVGKKGRIGGRPDAKEVEFSDGTEVFEGAHPGLLTAMQLHLEMRRNLPMELGDGAPYSGIRMVDEIDWKDNFKGKDVHEELVEKRMNDYNNYVARGGVMVEADMVHFP